MSKKIVKIEISHDAFALNPCEDDGWKAYSFNSRHGNFRHPDEFYNVTWDEEYRQWNWTPKIGVRRQLDVGTAFELSYSEHGPGTGKWGIFGRIYLPDFDSCRHAGIMIWQEPVKNLGPKKYEDREKDAESFIKEYTEFCNGSCYCYTVYFEDDEKENSCIFYGSDDLFPCLKAEYPKAFQKNGKIREDIEIEGDSKWIVE